LDFLPLTVNYQAKTFAAGKIPGGCFKREGKPPDAETLTSRLIDRSRRATRHATSDWMDLERQRGISITSSVLQFDYAGHRINLLDTPGHQDFSEDTYRTLTAADAAVMLIDCAKGVEAQTRKLFEVCRLRAIPIFTFVNKLDREGRPPLEILSELAEVLGIGACPLYWPLGMGQRFRGVYDLRRRQVLLFRSQWALNWVAERHPGLALRAAA